MNNFKDLYSKIEKVLSGMKFAVVIISIFTIALIVGTFQESYHGADYANRFIYKSWWFMLIQFLMFVSIVMAVVVRLPLKKRLYGFYTIHAGLVILFIGSLFTYLVGIDGSIQLLPNTPTNKIVINEDLLRVHYEKANKAYKYPLPYSAHKTKLNEKFQKIELLDYFPYAENETKWIDDTTQNTQSGEYFLFNDNVSQELILSLHPQTDFKASANLGPLTVHFMPSILSECIGKKTKDNLILWNLETLECKTTKDLETKIEQTPNGSRFIIVKYNEKLLTFFPDFSPAPLNPDKTKILDSPLRVLSLDVFIKKPNLFIFGEEAAYYSKFKKRWLVKDLKEIINLPWMNFKLRKIRFETKKYPVNEPVAVIPIQDNNEIIKGAMSALEIKYQGKQFWVTSEAPLKISNGSEVIRFMLSKKELRLPYELTLQNFKMNKYPGTNNPASFESFVNLLDGRGTDGVKKHHIFMNNPLKYDSFTFYQSNYFPLDQEQTVFGSVLSVNYDPGRFFKYLASLLIVLGSAWHFIINRKKRKI